MSNRVDVSDRRLAFAVMRSIDGSTLKVMPDDLKAWSRVDADPLEGRRLELAQAVRGGARFLIFEGDECPIRQGEVYHLPCGEIRVGKVTRKLHKGKGTEWQVDYVHATKDRLYYLRNVTPSPKPGEQVGEATEEERERARIDGNYSHSRVNGGDELPAVPPDWVDEGASEREQRRQAAQVSVQQERQRQAAKSRLNRLLAGAETPEQLEHMLRFVVQACENMEELKEAA